jgi:cell division transport system permease protein
MISRVRYVLREMWASMSRNKTLTAATVITSTVSLLLFGLTLLIQRGFDNQLEQWSGGVEMIVYVNNGADPGQVQVIQQELLRNTTVVASAEYCDEACATKVAQTIYAGDPDTLQRLLPKIPSYFKVVPVDKSNSDLLRSLKDSFRGLPKVYDVSTPDQAVEVLGQLQGFFGVRTLFIAVGLLGASALLIWNTIRTAMFARRREIEVMKLVGATNWFIRLPFMLEGLVQGIAGAVLGGLLMLFVNNDWTNGVRAFPAETGLEGFVVTDGYPMWVWGAMILVGALVGAIGSGTAASKFLDV